MAEKKFKGAPFGTQTARFDVTGVHPKTKVPGGFTQIPYDKYSMMELNPGTDTSKKPSQKRPQPFKCTDSKNVVQYMDSHLNNIKIHLAQTKEGMNKIGNVHKKFSNKHPDIKTSTNEQNLNKTSNKNFVKSPGAKCSINNINTLSTNTLMSRINQNVEKTQANPDLNQSRNTIFGDRDDTESKQYDSARKKQSEFKPNRQSFFMSFSKKSIASQSQPFLSGKHSEALSGRQSSGGKKYSDDIHSSQKLNRGSVNPPESVKFDKYHSTSMFSNISEQVSDFQWQKGSRDFPRIIANSWSSSGETSSGTFSQTSSMKDMEVTSNPSEVGSESLKQAENQEDTPKQSIQTRKSVFRERKSIHHKAKADKKRRRKSCRFAMLEGETCDAYLKRKLGPGTYNVMVGGFNSASVDVRTVGTGWARQLEVERLAALPHLLHKEQWEENRLLKRKLGPGSYEIKDFIQLSEQKPRSERGICEKLASRFDRGVVSANPGPGTYGIGGVPQRALEIKDKKSASTKGILDAGDRKRNLPSVGSHLGPGTYRHKTCTDEMLQKMTSMRGPYELYSGDRNKPITEGYLAAPKLADLGPGQYEIGSFVDEWSDEHKKTKGRFGKIAQYPEVPTERIFIFSKTHYPKVKDSPGPGSYSPIDLSKPKAYQSPGFLSSAKRDDKVSQKFFTRNFNPVGAGRYDIQKFDDAQDTNGHTSVFKSKTGKPGLQMAKFLH